MQNNSNLLWLILPLTMHRSGWVIPFQSYQVGLIERQQPKDGDGRSNYSTQARATAFEQ